MLHDNIFGYFITLVLYSIPLIGRVIYLDCMKYHSITIHNATLRPFWLPKYITLYISASESFIIKCDT